MCPHGLSTNIKDPHCCLVCVSAKHGDTAPFEFNDPRQQLSALLEGLEAPPEFWMTQPPFILKKLGEEIAKTAKRASQ